MAQRFVYMAVAVTFLIAETAVLHAQDLTIQIKNCPTSVKVGQALNNSLRVVVGNVGGAAVKNVAVEMVLKKNAVCKVPERRAVYSPNYFDGVLLQGGRESVSLDKGQTTVLTLHGMNTIPEDTPVGRTYFLCAVIDPGNAVKESNESNNCACCAVKIAGIEEKPKITGYGEACINKSGAVTILGRNFGSGAGKTVVLGGSGIKVSLPVVSWADSMIMAQVPDDARIVSGQRYFIGIQKTDSAEWLSNIDAYVATCPTQKPSPVPHPAPPVPPFFYE